VLGEYINNWDVLVGGGNGLFHASRGHVRLLCLGIAFFIAVNGWNECKISRSLQLASLQECLTSVVSCYNFEESSQIHTRSTQTPQGILDLFSVFIVDY
jgi:hypothetical protein